MDLGISQNHRIVALCSWLMNHRPIWVTLCSSLRGFGEGERRWVTPALKTLCGENTRAHPSLAKGSHGAKHLLFLLFSLPHLLPRPFLFLLTAAMLNHFFPNISSSQHLQAPSTSLPSKPVHLPQHPYNSSTLFFRLHFSLCLHSFPICPVLLGIHPRAWARAQTCRWSGLSFPQVRLWVVS